MNNPDYVVIDRTNHSELLSRHGNNNEERKYYLKSQNECKSLDLSKHGITMIADEFLGRYVNIEFLYLEGNELSKLNTAFFPTLKQLKWLDLRNNKLTMIPNTIQDHPSLQVLLLEGNNLETIPVEIGSVTSLRGLQLARNPIKFPPQNIVNQGVQSTIEFLRKQWQQLQSPQQIHLISETHSQAKTASPKLKHETGRKQNIGACKSAVVLKVRSQEVRKPRKVQSGLCTANLSKCISVQPISRRGQQVSAQGNKWDTDNDVDEIINPANCEIKSRSYTKHNKSVPPNHYKIKRDNTSELQSKFLRDIWIEKVREMLLRQEAILQRRKNAEALEQWQDEAKVLQQKQPKRDSTDGINFPYDTDPEYLNILSRKDLKEEGGHKRRDSSLHQIKHEEPINSKIVSIMAALQELQTSQSATSVSPRSEQRILSQEIKKIKDIQRSLSALKLKNFGQLGFSS